VTMRKLEEDLLATEKKRRTNIILAEVCYSFKSCINLLYHSSVSQFKVFGMLFNKTALLTRKLDDIRCLILKSVASFYSST